MTKQRHAFLSLMILILLLGLAYLVLVKPALDARYAFSEQWESLQFEKQKLQQTIAKSESVLADIEYLKQQDREALGFMKQQSEALAAAQLQQLLTDIVTKNDSSLISTQVLETEVSESFSTVTLSVNLRANVQSLQNIIYYFYDNDSVFLIDNISIQSKNNALTADAYSTLDIRFELSGFMKREASL